MLGHSGGVRQAPQICFQISDSTVENLCGGDVCRFRQKLKNLTLNTLN